MIELVRTAWLALTVYAALGVLFAGAFHWRGLARLDAGVQGAGWVFRLLITPGIAALWPLLAVRWLRFTRGASFLGGQDAPVSPRRLRATHRLAWKALVVLVPLLLGIALLTRPKEIEGSKLPAQASEPKPALNVKPPH
jgi:hypothetical protein